MIKSKLVKAFMLGLCMSAITSAGSAYAMAVSSPASAGTEEISDELKALYSKQAEIDQILFGDYARQLEEKKIMVNYTGVVEDYIEIGISTYSDENANYIYELVGKDDVKVVAFDESIIYATTVVDPVPATDDGTVTDGGSTGASDPASTDVIPNKEEIYSTTVAPDAADDGKVYKDGDVEIQIESVEDAVVADDAAAAAEDNVLYTTTADGLNPEAADVQTLSGEEAQDAVKRGGDEASEGVSAPIVVLAIAGGAALVGGSIIVSKKKNTK